jgi:hypothetical protein
MSDLEFSVCAPGRITWSNRARALGGAGRRRICHAVQAKGVSVPTSGNKDMGKAPARLSIILSQNVSGGSTGILLEIHRSWLKG